MRIRQQQEDNARAAQKALEDAMTADSLDHITIRRFAEWFGKVGALLGENNPPVLARMDGQGPLKKYRNTITTYEYRISVWAGRSQKGQFVVHYHPAREVDSGGSDFHAKRTRAGDDKYKVELHAGSWVVSALGLPGRSSQVAW